jgi:hypothetical protein
MIRKWREVELVICPTLKITNINEFVNQLKTVVDCLFTVLHKEM